MVLLRISSGPLGMQVAVYGGAGFFEATSVQSGAAARREEEKRLKATRGSESWSRDSVQQTRGRVIISVGIPARAMGIPGKGE